MCAQLCPGCPSEASHSHNIIYYFHPADSPPSRIIPRWRVLYWITRQLLHYVRCGSFSHKLRQLTPLSKADPANPRCFILLCGISCVHQPNVSSESTMVGWGQTNLSQLYFSRLSLAMPAKLNFFKTPASVRLVSSRSVSTSTGISGCFQPGQAKVLSGPTPLVISWHLTENDSVLKESVPLHTNPALLYMYRSRIHERTISLRLMDIILRVLRLEVSVWIS